MRAKVLLFATLIIFGIGVWTAQTHTAKFVDSANRVLESAIAEQRFMSIQGDQHYVLIRGKDITKPLLLYLHGGPGFTGMPFVRKHNAALEQDFVMVNWDQRATGKSYHSQSSPDQLTIEQMVLDVDDLVSQLLSEFRQSQIVLMGHSWGSMLGLEYIQRYPEKVSLYIGIGQAGSQAKSEAMNYQWVLNQAIANQDQSSIELLEQVGPPPYKNVKDMMRERGVVNQYQGAWPETKSLLDFAAMLTAVDEFSWWDLINVLRSDTFSLAPLFDYMSNFDATVDHQNLEVPVVFMIGRNDRVIAAAESKRYYDILNAPYKAFEWFDQSAHNPHSTESEKFNRLVLTHYQQVTAGK